MNRTANIFRHAIDAALAGDWDIAHEQAQALEGDPLADWLHAVLHKMEPDEPNTRYWYRRAGRSYDDFADVETELEAIRNAHLHRR